VTYLGVTGVTHEYSELIDAKLEMPDRWSRALFQDVAKQVVGESLAPEDQDGVYIVRK
jgi:hypothetical protein